MIRKDFETGGFPINRRCPVLCTTETGDIFIAYNRFTLVLTLKNRTIKKCVGIWPGRFTTDCFPLKIECYINLSVPPQEHREIDDSPEIKVIYERPSKFRRVSYVKENFDGNKIDVVSEDECLKNYVIGVGLKYTTLMES